MEFDEKELRKEISYAIKNIHGVRQVETTWKQASTCSTYQYLSASVSVCCFVCVRFCVQRKTRSVLCFPLSVLFVMSLINVLALLFLLLFIPPVCLLLFHYISSSLSSTTPHLVFLCVSVCLSTPSLLRHVSMSVLSVCPSGQACSPQTWRLRP